MMIIDTLCECPYCGADFNKTKPNYNFCSYVCAVAWREEESEKPNIPVEVKQKWAIKNYIYTNLWYMGYRPSLNWRRWDDEDFSDEFDRLMWRDA